MIDNLHAGKRGRTKGFDGLFDVLRVNMQADIAMAGRYVVVARLFSDDGELLGEASIDRELQAGTQSLALDFNGRNIAELRKSGPYILEYAYLYDGNGSLMDALPTQYATAAYDCEWVYLASRQAQDAEPPSGTIAGACRLRRDPGRPFGTTRIA